AYIAFSKHNRIAGNANPFKAYRINEAIPKVGDLVCKSRARSGATYDNIRVGMKTHCDVVTGVAPDGLEVIGGNVSNSVLRRKVRVDSAGHVTDPDYFAVIKVDAKQPAVTSNGGVPVLPGVDGITAPRLLKRETTPPGSTLYLGIDLKITDQFGITAPQM